MPYTVAAYLFMTIAVTCTLNPNMSASYIIPQDLAKCKKHKLSTEHLHCLLVHSNTAAVLGHIGLTFPPNNAMERSKVQVNEHAQCIISAKNKQLSRNPVRFKRPDPPRKDNLSTKDIHNHT